MQIPVFLSKRRNLFDVSRGVGDLGIVFGKYDVRDWEEVRRV